MRSRTRALFNLSGAARLVGEAAENLADHANAETLRRLGEIRAELQSIEEQQREAVAAAKR